MVGADFMDLLNKFKVTTYVGIEDFTDRLNFLFSCTFLLLCATIVTVKTYFISPLSCYIPTPVSGSGNVDYVTAWCWTEGTYALDIKDFDKVISHNLDKIADKKIHYYQWVPFVLGLQCILFYLPRAIWQFFAHNCTGTDLEYLVNIANDAVHADPEKRKKLLDHINRSLVTLLYQHREYRSGNGTIVKRHLHGFFSFLFPSKRLGTKLIHYYFLVKILYAGNSIGQLYLMHYFLNMNKSFKFFGIELLKNLIEKKDWQNTFIFPRVGCCGMNLKTAAATHFQIAQCALPVNMLNEKIYIFLWCWVFLVCVFNCLSILTWIYRMISMSNHNGFIRKFLKINGVYKKELKDFVHAFCKQFLRHDGIFLLKMISINAGDVVCSDIILRLWETWKKKYLDRDFRQDVPVEANKSPAIMDSNNPESAAALALLANQDIPNDALKQHQLSVGFPDDGKKPLIGNISPIQLHELKPNNEEKISNSENPYLENKSGDKILRYREANGKLSNKSNIV